MTVPEAAFREQFRAFTREEVAAFLVDLWTARGWDADRTDDDAVVLTGRRGAATETVFPLGAPDGWPPEPEVDVVVDATGSRPSDDSDGVTVLDSADLYRQVRYAVPRDVSDDLLATHFDVRETTDEHGDTSHDDGSASGLSVSEPGGGSAEQALTDQDSETSKTGTAESSDRSETDRDGSSDAAERLSSGQFDAGGGGRESEQSGRDAGGPDVSNDGEEGSSEGPGEARETADGAAWRPTRRTVLLAGGALVVGIGTVVGTQLPRGPEPAITVPGLTEAGVEQPGALATAHVTSLGNNSYTLELDRFGHRSDRALRSYLSMDLRLAADRSYLTHVATNGPEAPAFLGTPPMEGVFWSDGDAHLSRISSGDEPTYNSFEPPGGHVGTWRYWAETVPFGGTYGSGPDRFVESVFGAIPTRLVERRDTDAGTVYRVVDEQSMSPSSTSLAAVGASDVRDVRLGAEIDENGIVTSFELRFSAVLDGERVDRFHSLDYAKIGETAVERPEWADAVDS